MSHLGLAECKFGELNTYFQSIIMISVAPLTPRSCGSASRARVPPTRNFERGAAKRKIMSKVLIDNVSPVTQSVQAVVELLTFLGMPSELPAVIKLANDGQLTRSSKGDCYYYTSPKGCSCPGYFYRHSCKHVKALAFSSSKPHGQTLEQTLEEHDRNLHKMPKSYQRMVYAAREEAEAMEAPDSLINRGGFKPVYPGEEGA